MPSTDQSFGTNNPFRRKTSIPSSEPVTTRGPAIPSTKLDDVFDAPASAARPPFTTFRTAAPEEDKRDEQPVQPRPKKIVKKVRVQSPLPSSPEDAIPVTSYLPKDRDDSSSSSESREENDLYDPFNAYEVPSEPPLPRPPPNPFSKTLQDLEQSAQGQDANTVAGGGAKGSLDVDSFKRLLLTGYANITSPLGGTGGLAPGPIHDGASNTDESSISRQSIFDAIRETPRTSHETEPEELEERRETLPSSPLLTVESTSGRKKPSPPSSRHGKLIKLELGANAAAPGIAKAPPAPTPVDAASSPSWQSSLTHSPLSGSDVNKPLPLPPSRNSVEEFESPFDREAAGRLPETYGASTSELDSMMPPTTASTRPRSKSRSSTLTASGIQKPAVPRPRRHGRSESKAAPVNINTTNEDPPRSSLESSRSQADSLRANISGANASLAAPVPPPTRRPNHARQGSSFVSPTAGSSTSVSSQGESDEAKSPLALGFSPMETQRRATMATVITSKDGLPKLSPPPPPPARHSSTRRPPSISSIETGSGIAAAARKVSREKEGGGMTPPPPPPPRARGSSRGSLTSGDMTRRPSGEVPRVEEEPADDSGPTGGVELLKGLEELEMLKREVEAALGKGGAGNG